MKKLLPPPLKIASVYFSVSLLWVLFSDRLVKLLYPDIERIVFFQSLKGTLFVLVTGVLVFFLVRTEMRRENRLKEDLVESLNEKEALLHEIHHRVKNNLQLISSLLTLQESEYSDKVCSACLMKSDLRIRSMALVHEQLYERGAFSRINLKTYIEDLVSMLNASFAAGSRIVRFSLRVEPVEVNLDKAVSFGLVMNELIVNSLTHAFTEMTEGYIEVALREHGALIIASVSDNGKGIDVDRRSIRQTGLGLTFVDSVVRQLKGRFLYTNLHPGTLVSFHFPVS